MARLNKTTKDEMRIEKIFNGDLDGWFTNILTQLWYNNIQWINKHLMAELLLEGLSDLIDEFLSCQVLISGDARKKSEKSHFIYSFELATRIARSLVIPPFSTVSITAASKLLQKFSRSWFLSSCALWRRPLVQAKIEAMELVEVSFP